MPLHVLEQEGREVFRAICDQCEVQGELAGRSEEALRGFFLCQDMEPANERGTSDSVTLCDACYRMNIGFPSARPEAVVEEILTTLQQVQGAEMVDIRPGSFMRTLVEVMVRQFTDVQGLQHRLIQELGRAAQVEVAQARAVAIPVAVDLTINVETPEGVDAQQIRELVEARLREELAHPIRTVHAAGGTSEPEDPREGRQRLAQAMINPLRRRLDYASVAQAAFPVEQMPPGAVPIYDRDPVDPVKVPDWAVPGCLVRHREQTGTWRVVEVTDGFVVLRQDENRWPWNRRIHSDFEFYQVLPKSRYEHILGE